MTSYPSHPQTIMVPKYLPGVHGWRKFTYLTRGIDPRRGASAG
jgi:hypothetical protein